MWLGVLCCLRDRLVTLLLSYVLVLQVPVTGQGRFLYLGEGERCSVRGGLCQPETLCSRPSSTASAASNSTAKKTSAAQLDVCSMRGSVRIVCCPPPPPASGTAQGASQILTKAEAMCEFYKEFVFAKSPTLSLFAPKIDECGWDPKKLIVGGVNAHLREFPHMVLLGYGTRDKGGRVRQWGCGGSLISERYILSAAHCERPKGATSEVRWANVGDLNIRASEQVDGAPGRIVAISHRFLHPGYRADVKYNDIALFRLAANLRLSPYMRPACLPPRSGEAGDSDLAQRYIATGWGKTGPDLDDWKPTLQKVELRAVPSAECSKAYEGFRQIPTGIDPATMICAGGTQGNDTCYGDSGGPIQVKLNKPYCMFSLVGITSFGKEGRCGYAGPSVYTRVAPFVPWIESIVWPPA